MKTFIIEEITKERRRYFITADSKDEALNVFESGSADPYSQRVLDTISLSVSIFEDEE